MVVEEKSILYFLIGYAAEAVMKPLEDVLMHLPRRKQLLFAPLTAYSHVSLRICACFRTWKVYCAMLMQTAVARYVT